MSEDTTYDVTTLEGVDSLDQLLGISDDKINSVDTNDLDFGEEEKIEYPHFRVSSKKFADAMKLSSIVSQGSGRDLVSKTVAFEVKGGELQFYFTDSDVYIQKSIEIGNTDNILEDYIAVNYEIISKLVRACSSITTVYKKDSKYYIRLIGGDVELETIKANKENMMLPKEKFTVEGELVTSDFYKIIRNLFVLASSSITAAQRRIFFRDDKVYSIFLYCLARYDGVSKMPEMDLSIKDMKLLYALSMACEDKELAVSRSNNRVLISGSNFSYSFQITDHKPTQPMIDSMTKIFSGNDPIYVDYDQIVKIVNVSCDLAYSTSKLDLNYTDDGTIECILRTKRSDSMFVLRGLPNTALMPMDKYVSIQSSLLKVLLKVFSQDSSIGLILSPEGIGLKSDSYTAVLYTEG